MLTITLILVAILMLLGTPFFAILGILPIILFGFLTDVPIENMLTNIKMIFGQPVLSALPIFTVMGYVMSYGNFSQRMANAADHLFGWIPGGLALTTILSYTIFSAITGGSAVAVMALGGIYFGALIKSGYDQKFSLGICTVFGGGGMLFPPSLPIIVLGFVAMQPIDELYISALLPGIVVVGLFLVYVQLYSRYKKIKPKKFHFKDAYNSVKDIAEFLPLPIIIVGGIFSGWMTISEIAVVCLVYTIITQCFIRKDVSFHNLKRAGIDGMILVGALFVIMVSAMSLSNFLVDQQIPQQMLVILQEIISSRLVFLLLLNVILLITGCMMDIFSAILVMIPLLLPVAVGYGIDPIHFAVIFLWNLEIGYSTPPVGFNLFIGAFRFKQPLEKLWVAAIPGLGVQVAGLLLITYWPQLTLWLPRVLGFTRDIIVL